MDSQLQPGVRERRFFYFFSPCVFTGSHHGGLISKLNRGLVLREPREGARESGEVTGRPPFGGMFWDVSIKIRTQVLKIGTLVYPANKEASYDPL